MGTFTSASNSNLFVEGYRKCLADNLAQWKGIYSQLFSIKNSNKLAEKDQSMFGVYEVPVVTENENFPELDVSNGYTKTYTHVQYGAELVVSRIAKENELYGFIPKFRGLLEKAMIQTIEQTASNVFVNAATTTAPDGVYLLSLTHPCIDGTQANKPTVDADLGYSTLEAAKIAILKRKSWENHPVQDSGGRKILMFAPDNWAMVEKLMKTSGMPFSADNTVNPLMGMFTPLMNPYMTDTDMWLVLDQPNDDGALFWWRIRPELREYMDDKNLSTHIQHRMMFSCGITDWRKSILYGTTG